MLASERYLGILCRCHHVFSLPHLHPGYLSGPECCCGAQRRWPLTPAYKISKGKILSPISYDWFIWGSLWDPWVLMQDSQQILSTFLRKIWTPCPSLSEAHFYLKVGWFLSKWVYKSGSRIFKNDVYLTFPHSNLNAKAFGSHFIQQYKIHTCQILIEKLIFELICSFGQNHCCWEGLYLPELV